MVFYQTQAVIISFVSQGILAMVVVFLGCGFLRVVFNTAPPNNKLSSTFLDPVNLHTNTVNCEKVQLKKSESPVEK